MAAIKYSRQRKAIKDFLMTRKDHPTAETVYLNVRETYPHISLGTVYRNLTLLSDMGDIQKLHLGDGLDHFDADTHPHDHFLCTECGAVLDIDLQSDDDFNMDERANSAFDGMITGHITYFHGICPACCKTSV
ncbi:MAG: transcriptional repressor [Lachnospiraceae bacterium]|nr:transcriptional repressor [Lachnospiraceae bacterium]